MTKRIQSAVDSALTHVFDTKVRAGSGAQAAVVVMTRDGAVRALVGGRRVHAAGNFNRATQALRQTGSLFKPFVYAAALETGYSFDDRIIDEPVTYHVRGSGPWTPKNYKGEYLGEITLTDALAFSVNTVAVKLSEGIGRHRVAELARRVGIGEHLARGPAMALGASESTLLAMTSAYASILNGGRRVDPYGVVNMRLKGQKQSLMSRVDSVGERVFSEETARQLIYMMHRVVTDGTGMRAMVSGTEVAGKTGTTQEARDAWFIGFSADYITGVWMGYDDNTPLTGVTGSGLPADIWRETMLRIHEDTTARPLPMINPGLVPDGRQVKYPASCRFRGLIPEEAVRRQSGSLCRTSIPFLLVACGQIRDQLIKTALPLLEQRPDHRAFKVEQVEVTRDHVDDPGVSLGAAHEPSQLIGSGSFD